MYPVRVPDGSKKKYTHAFVLNRLNIRVQEFVVPAMVTEQDEMLQLYVRLTFFKDQLNCLLGRARLRTSTDALDTLAILVNAYVMYQSGQDQPNGGTLRPFSLSQVFQGQLFDGTALQRLHSLRRLVDEVGFPPDRNPRTGPWTDFNAKVKPALYQSRP